MDEDPRAVELETISAIYPEIVFDANNPFAATLELPVCPEKAVTVVFPSATLPTPPSSESEDGGAVVPTAAAGNLESHTLKYLPSLNLRITLPEGYPAEQPPKFELSTSPEWLPRARLDELQANGERMWEENGGLEVVYDFIDSLQQAAENAFGCGEGQAWEVPQEYMISLLDFDIKATRAAFDKQTFDCGPCMEPKKGAICHKMVDCAHVFCVECLQDFYNNAIKEGDLVSVRCLEPGCAKAREESQLKKKKNKKNRKSKTQLAPSELLQIPLEHDMVTRYVRLKRKADLESDKNTIYCPRKWCQGAAKSKKHRKIVESEAVESDDESDTEDITQNKEKDLLAICEDCDYAFCSRCGQGWHGDFQRCTNLKPNTEISPEEQASLHYVFLHTTPCPTCSAPAQKAHGCNHMICFKCSAHFCYLCSAWLEPTNPYHHYNNRKTGCYQRLWELEGGDGDDVGIGFHGGNHPPNMEDEVDGEEENEVPVVEPPPQVENLNEDDVQLFAAEAAAVAAQHVAEMREQLGLAQPAEPLPHLQREGPLVLRINQLPPAPAPAVPDPPQPAARRNPRQHLLQAGAPARLERHRFGHPAEGVRDRARREAAAQAVEVANQRWLQRFLAAAANDEEDLLDSEDEDGDDEAWQIPQRA